MLSRVAALTVSEWVIGTVQAGQVVGKTAHYYCAHREIAVQSLRLYSLGIRCIHGCRWIYEMGGDSRRAAYG